MASVDRVGIDDAGIDLSERLGFVGMSTNAWLSEWDDQQPKGF